MNYTVIRSDELQHHGVLGMKWGVRRYQNEDGSLTPAGEKRYNKNLAYRDKVVSKNEKRISDSTQKRNEAKESLKDLKKNGMKSKTYQLYEMKKREERRAKYDRTHSGENHDVHYERLMNDVSTAFERWSGSGMKEAMKHYEDMKNRNQSIIDKYTARNEDIANMEITALTSRRQIRRGK